MSLLVVLSCLVCPSGGFELTDDSGHPAGHIEVMLKWKSTYLVPSSSISTTKDGQYFLLGSTFLLTGSKKEEVEQEKEVLPPWLEEEKDETQEEERANGDAVNATSQPDRAACQVIRYRLENSSTIINLICVGPRILNTIKPFFSLNLAAFSQSGSSA